MGAVRDSARRLTLGAILALGILVSAGSPAAAQGLSAGVCSESYTFEFTPPISMTAGSGSYRMPQPGSIECSGILNGRDITGSGTIEFEGTYGDRLTSALGGDSCLIANFSVSPRVVLTNRAGETVEIAGEGEVVRLATGGIVKGTFNGAPVTGIFTTVAAPGQDCPTTGLSTVEVTMRRLIGI